MTKKPKFRIGDRVVVARNKFNGGDYPIGTELVVKEILSDSIAGIYCYFFINKYIGVYEPNLELAKISSWKKVICP